MSGVVSIVTGANAEYGGLPWMHWWQRRVLPLLSWLADQKGETRGKSLAHVRHLSSSFFGGLGALSVVVAALFPKKVSLFCTLKNPPNQSALFDLLIVCHFLYHFQPCHRGDGMPFVNSGEGRGWLA